MELNEPKLYKGAMLMSEPQINIKELWRNFIETQLRKEIEATQEKRLKIILRPYVYLSKKGPKKFKLSPRCSICSKIFNTPKAHKYYVCWRCRQTLIRKLEIEKRKNKQICVVVNIDEFVNLIEGMQNNNIKLNKIGG